MLPCTYCTLFIFKKTSQSSVITVILSFQTATATDNSYKTDAELNKNNQTNQNEKQSE